MCLILFCTKNTFVARIDELIYLPESEPVPHITRQDYQDDFRSMNNLNAEEPLFNREIACQPGKIYQYPCILCVCHPSGYFHASDCIHVCHNVSMAVSHHAKCTPKTIFKVDCNLCYCPQKGLIDEQYCSQKTCKPESWSQTVIATNPILKTPLEKKTALQFLRFHKFKLLSKTQCTASTFTKPLCQYCGCHTDGKINFDKCVEVNCNIAYKGKPMYCDTSAFTGICQQCLCTKNSTIIDEYCHYSCSGKSKAFILKKLVAKMNIVLFSAKKHLNNSNSCQPGSLYKSAQQYCYCPSSGVFNKDYCLVFNDAGNTDDPNIDGNDVMVFKRLESGASCVPGQYFRSSHKQCFCPITGQVDSDWCIDMDTSERDKTNSTCVSGQIVSVKCNLCFCSVNGNIDYSKCTRNKCGSRIKESSTDVTSCLRGTVYSIGCVSCMCPSDGQININYCHKTKDCVTEYDDLDTCSAGELYAQGCRICVCPHNAIKSDSVCHDGQCQSTHVARRGTFSPVVCDILEIRKNSNLCEMCLCGHCMNLECELIYSCQSGDVFHLGPRTCHCKPNNNWHALIECDNISSSDPLIGRSKCFVDLIGANTCTWTQEEADEALQRRDCTPGTMYYHGCEECICAFNRTLGNFCKNSTHFCESPYPGGAYFVSRAGINQEMIFLNANEDPMDPCLEGLLYYDGQCNLCPCVNGLLAAEECYSSVQSGC